MIHCKYHSVVYCKKCVQKIYDKCVHRHQHKKVREYFFQYEDNSNIWENIKMYPTSFENIKTEWDQSLKEYSPNNKKTI